MKRVTRVLAAIAIVSLIAAVGCSKKTPSGTGGTKKEVKIGFIGDLTGSNSALVVPGENAAALAFDQANAKGDLKVKITFVPLDNKEANPTTAPPLAQQLISDPEVVGVIGPAFSGETAAVQPLFKQAGLVHITQSATRASLTAGGFTTFFRGVGGDTDQAAAAAKLAVKGKSCSTVAVIDDKSAYGQGYGDIAAASVKALGATVVTRQSVAPATDYTSLVGTLTDKKPACVIYGGYEPQSSIIVKQMREKGVKAIFISGDGSKSTKFIPDAGKAAAEGVLFTCPCLDANVSTDPAAVQFVSDFKAKYNGTAPDIYAPEAYDIANIFVSVIKGCGDNVTRQCVLDGVTNLKDFKGLSKTFNWTTDPKALHEVTDKGVNIYEIKNGAITLDGNINTVVP
ncbi:MAG TPA: branched-chain amino acid ABC transporter substrate-binding protein [Actinomycetota bacterium]|nr:branched-chain amino acid ABC transporter substrate-binding protein [Actinomycetota bacterium]